MRYRRNVASLDRIDIAVVVLMLFVAAPRIQMTLPPCKDCQAMLDIVNAGEEAFYAQNPRPVMAYDRYWYGENSMFAQQRSFEEFAFGWKVLNEEAEDRNCLPTTCNQVFMWWDTCWDNPRGLLPATPENDGGDVASPFIPFILFTVLLMRPISSIFQAIYEALNRSLTKLENWATLEKYKAHHTQRHFVAYFIDVFWFNIIIVFVLVRFGPAIMHQELEICTQMTVRAVASPDNNTVVALDMQPMEDVSAEFTFGGAVDFWYVLKSASYVSHRRLRQVKHVPQSISVKV